MWPALSILRIRLRPDHYLSAAHTPGCHDVAVALEDVQALADASIRLVEHVRRHFTAQTYCPSVAPPGGLEDPLAPAPTQDSAVGSSRAVDDARRAGFELVALDIGPELDLHIRVHGTDGMRSAVALLLRTTHGAQHVVRSLAVNTSDLAWLGAFNGQFAAVVGASLEAATSAADSSGGHLNPISFDSLASLRRLAAAVCEATVTDATGATVRVLIPRVTTSPPA